MKANSRTVHPQPASMPPSELKSTHAVQMNQQEHSYRNRDVLQESVGLVMACCQRYESAGLERLQSNYWGTQGYLSDQQKQEMFDWLAQQDCWTIERRLSLRSEDT